MLEFELPWAFFCLPLPLLAYWLLPKSRQQQAAVRVPFYADLQQMQHTGTAKINLTFLKLFALLSCWLCLVTAAASQKWIGDAITLPASGRHLMLAVDLSGSMKKKDMVISGKASNRLIAVKQVLDEFIERLKTNGAQFVTAESAVEAFLKH